MSSPSERFYSKHTAATQTSTNCVFFQRYAVCVCICDLPVRTNDALCNRVSYLVENIFVVGTADEELILGDKNRNILISCTKVTNIFCTVKKSEVLLWISKLHAAYAVLILQEHEAKIRLKL